MDIRHATILFAGLMTISGQPMFGMDDDPPLTLSFTKNDPNYPVVTDGTNEYHTTRDALQRSVWIDKNKERKLKLTFGLKDRNGVQIDRLCSKKTLETTGARQCSSPHAVFKVNDPDWNSCVTSDKTTHAQCGCKNLFVMSQTTLIPFLEEATTWKLKKADRLNQEVTAAALLAIIKKSKA